jgi:hypothetical protein
MEHYTDLVCSFEFPQKYQVVVKDRICLQLSIVACADLPRSKHTQRTAIYS